MRHVPNYNNLLSSCLLIAVITLLASATGILAQQAGTSPIKIFILAGQSNMQGQGEISLFEQVTFEPSARIDDKTPRKRT